MEQKMLTIAIPSYNVSQYLGETLESLLACKNVDMLDVIVVDDGSTDNTKEIACSYEERFLGNLTVISKENGGHGSTVNAALEDAKGKYFAVIDGDDWVESAVLDELLAFLEGKDSDVIITGHYRDYMDIDKHVYYPYMEESGFVCGMDYVWEKKYRFPMTDICYKTQLLKGMGFKMQHHTFYVDEEFCTLPFAYVKSICFFCKGYYHYRLGNPAQSVSIDNQIKRIDNRIRVFDNIYKKTKDNQIAHLNRLYIDYKLSGLAKKILAIYYTDYADVREGRTKGDDFYKTIKIEYPRVFSDCKNRILFFKLMNSSPLVKRLINYILFIFKK